MNETAPSVERIETPLERVESFLSEFGIIRKSYEPTKHLIDRARALFAQFGVNDAFFDTGLALIANGHTASPTVQILRDKMSSNKLLSHGREDIEYPSTSRIDWREDAECIQHPTDMFFPKNETTNSRPSVEALAAIAVCEVCPVRNDCLEYAMETKVGYGIWGGMISKQRVALRRRKARVKR